MRSFQSSRRGFCRGSVLQAATVATLLGVFVTVAACTGSAGTTVDSSAAAAATTEPTQAVAGASLSAIELTDDGFTPDRVEVTQGTRITLTNSTDSKKSVVVKGRDFQAGDDGKLDIEAGETLDLNLYQVGAYVLTLGDDPQTTASVFVS